MANVPGLSWVAGLVARARSVWRGLRGRSAVEAEMTEEFRHHLTLRTEHLMREGLSPKEAARRARVEFGHVETHREHARAARGLGPFDRLRFSWIDVKLGIRMLGKHPALTIVSVFTLAIGIPVGLAPMHVANAVEAPLPEDPGDRIRAIRYQDPVTGGLASGTYFDFDLWRSELSGFAAVAAFRNSSYNVASDDGLAAPVLGAEVTGRTFEMLATPPVLGRTLQQADAAAGAPDVAVIGYDLWRSRFGGDPDIVGRSVRIGRVPYTVVGVMPRGFLFPARQQLWLPMREERAAVAGQGLALSVFGRLADGVSAKRAQVELAALGGRIAATLPEERARLRGEVVPFGLGQINVPAGGVRSIPGFYGFQLLAVVLLLVACANVAMLVFARTATRFRELAVRTALGASRARIVSQIFAETMVLAVLAAGVGLVSIDFLLGRLEAAVVARSAILPYWLTLRLTPGTAALALLLAVLSATVAGVVPALRITGRRIQDNIRRADAGRSGIRFGGVTGVLVVLDVAFAVTVVGFVTALAQQMRDVTLTDRLVGIPADEYLAAEIRLPVNELRTGDGAFDAAEAVQRIGAVQQRLVDRLEAEPRVRAVTVANVLPGMDHPSRRVEVDDADAAGRLESARYVRVARVDTDFFAKLGRRPFAGRDFDRADAAVETVPVIVNNVFADELLGGQNAVGRRVRFVTSRDGAVSPWHEIVGVVPHLGVNTINAHGDAAIYLPATPGTIAPMRVAIRLGDAPETFTPRLRQILAEVDPTAVVDAPVVLGTVRQGDWYLVVAVGAGLGLLVIVLIALAASGLYAMISFSVSERTREIGIRTALGAGSGAIVLTILRRSLIQVGIGALLGMPLSGRIFFALRSDAGAGGSLAPALLATLAFGAGVVLVIGLFSAIAPARRALAIRPAEALNTTT